MSHKVEIRILNVNHRGLSINYAVFLFESSLIVAENFNDYKSAEKWIKEYNKIFDKKVLELVKRD